MTDDDLYVAVADALAHTPAFWGVHLDDAAREIFSTVVWGDSHDVERDSLVAQCLAGLVDGVWTKAVASCAAAVGIDANDMSERIEAFIKSASPPTA
jgi:hypothetical protein